MSTELLECVEIETGPAPRHAVILMHGLGADGNDFVPIVGELQLRSPVRFVFPNAPMRSVTINGGFVMRAWYDILDGDFDRRADETGLRASQAAVEALITREVDRGIQPDRIVLAGFSQGGAVALHTGLRHAQRLAGIVALSTYLPLPQKVEVERHPANHATPIFMAHGAQDDIIPLRVARTSEQRLRGWGYDIEWHEYPMPHSVSMEEIRDLSRWLTRVVG